MIIEKQVARFAEWSKAHVSCVLLLGNQGFEPWFQHELESDWKLPRRDFPFKASWLQLASRQHVGGPLSKDI